MNRPSTTPMSKKRPLNTMFVITSMPVGGAETLLVNMLRRFDKTRINPSVCCLKTRDELGELISEEFPVFAGLIQHKFDLAVVKRLRALFQNENIDCVVTVGAGDKMFWGRLAARYSKIPVVLSALHSTGWPDGVGTLNRLLTRITTGFIAVAESHGQHLIHGEGFPAEKVFVIPNGIDTDRFQFSLESRQSWRSQLGIPDENPVVGIVAALRPEKNHTLFVESAARVLKQMEDAHFVIVGQGEEQEKIEALIEQRGISSRVHLPGCTHDIPGVLSMMDLFALTSHNEASPVSIMEALACQRPVVATDVGSVNESVIHQKSGLLVAEGDLDAMASAWLQVLNDTDLREKMGSAGREHIVANSSLDSMTEGYMNLIDKLFDKNAGSATSAQSPGSRVSASSTSSKS